MTRLVLPFALVAVAHATPVWKLVDLNLGTPIADLGANVGEDGVAVSLVPNDKVKSGVVNLIKSLGDAVGNIGEGVVNGVANVVDGTAGLVQEVGNALGNVAEVLRNDREEFKVDGENANSNAQEVAEEVSTGLVPPAESNLSNPIKDLGNDGNSDSNVQAIEDDLSASYRPVENGAVDLIGDLSTP